MTQKVLWNAEVIDQVVRMGDDGMGSSKQQADDDKVMFDL